VINRGRMPERTRAGAAPHRPITYRAAVAEQAIIDSSGSERDAFIWNPLGYRGWTAIKREPRGSRQRIT
jgi:hypothetical protein